MSTARFATLIGLAIGAVLAFRGFDAALWAGVFALIGYLVGLVVEGRVDVTEYLGPRDDTRSRSRT